MECIRVPCEFGPGYCVELFVRLIGIDFIFIFIFLAVFNAVVANVIFAVVCTEQKEVGENTFENGKRK